MKIKNTELAKFADVSRQTIANWIKNKNEKYNLYVEKFREKKLGFISNKRVIETIQFLIADDELLGMHTSNNYEKFKLNLIKKISAKIELDFFLEFLDYDYDEDSMKFHKKNFAKYSPSKNYMQHNLIVQLMMYSKQTDKRVKELNSDNTLILSKCQSFDKIRNLIDYVTENDTTMYVDEDKYDVIIADVIIVQNFNLVIIHNGHHRATMFKLFDKLSIIADKHKIRFFELDIDAAIKNIKHKDLNLIFNILKLERKDHK